MPATSIQGDKKAVMIFIHGQTFQNSGTNLPVLNGTAFASIGDVIIVTISYRIGMNASNSLEVHVN